MHVLGLMFFAYLMGSVPSGYWIGRWVGKVDVRTLGSQNIGATNVARNLGVKWGLIVLVMDMAKGALPVSVALYIWPAEAKQSFIKIAIVALAAFIGHLSSVFLRFRGGKGVATAFGISLILLPRAALAALALFLMVTWLWRYVSLGSITAVLTLPILTCMSAYPPIYVGLTSVFALCVVFRHRSNIRALLQGKERKI
ncbi:MAG: glycerol-3-phosphate 1-O-acyltransferase PlsY [Syntrophobacterales bacterium]